MSKRENTDTSSYWLDGNNFTYRNWKDSEPNSEGKCVRTNNKGKFEDKPCGDTYRYVCKGI